MNAGTSHRNRGYKKERKLEDRHVSLWPEWAVQVEKTRVQNMGAGVKDGEASVTLGGC